MLRFSRILLTGASALAAVAAGAHAQDIESQAHALKVISAFAAETCGTVATEGGVKKLELSGDAKAQLDGVIAKVVNAGISGAAKYQQEDYKNVLHEQLAQVLSQSANCRLDVFKMLQEKMIR